MVSLLLGVGAFSDLHAPCLMLDISPKLSKGYQPEGPGFKTEL